MWLLHPRFYYDICGACSTVPAFVIVTWTFVLLLKSWSLKMTFLKNSQYWIVGGLGRRLVVG
jgi:hypothetical protein